MRPLSTVSANHCFDMWQQSSNAALPYDRKGPRNCRRKANREMAVPQREPKFQGARLRGGSVPLADVSANRSEGLASATEAVTALSQSPGHWVPRCAR